MANYRSPCGAVITKQVPTNQGIIYRPALIFPIVNIQRQLQRLYNKKGYEESCRKWAARPNNDHELSDIYDGRIWKEFFFFQAEDGIRDYKVTGVQTCALPI